MTIIHKRSKLIINVRPNNHQDGMKKKIITNEIGDRKRKTW